jgi:tetratricopeptide (TPR) repeat protein
MFRLREDVPTLGTLFGDGGFRTAAFIAAFPLHSRYGFSRGFDTYDEELELPRERTSVNVYARRPARRVVDAVLDWLRGVPAGERWFAWAHFFDPHHPWEVTSSLDRILDHPPYNREIRGMDHEIGRLWRGVTEWGGGRPPITAVVSDHGEGLGDHREVTHGILLHEETMRGLLGLAAPAGTEAARRLGRGIRESVARYSDLLPTLLDLAGLSVSDDVEGLSWFDPSARGKGAYGETYYPTLHYGWSPLLSWRDERWTYVEGPDPELFDRDSDPGERTDVIEAHPEVAARLAAQVAALARDPAREEISPVDPEAREKLLALGYVTGTTSDPRRGKNPKELIDAVNFLLRGISLSGTGDHAGALPFLQRAYRMDPDNVSVLFYLADCLRELGDPTTARAYYRRSVERNPQMPEAWSHLAQMEFDRGDLDRAIELAEEGLSHSPEAAVLLLSAGDFRRARGDGAAAESFYRRAVEAEPMHFDTWAALARLLESRGNRAEADRCWARARDLAPGRAELPERFRTPDSSRPPARR